MEHIEHMDFNVIKLKKIITSVFIIICFFYFPYMTLVFITMMLAIANLYINDSKLIKVNSFIYYLISTFLVCLPYSTKTLTPVMNDKGFYWGYILAVKDQSFMSWFENFSGNDIFSYFLLKLSAFISLGSISTFFVFTLITYTILFYAIFRLTGRSCCLVIFLFISQYNFEGLYGNIIRQALGLSIFLLAISYEKKIKNVFYGILSSLSHFSFYIYLPIFLMPKKLMDIKTKNVILILFSCLIVGGVIIKSLINKLSSYVGFINDRAEAYQSGDYGNSITRKIILTLIFIGIIELIYNYLKKRNLLEDIIVKVRFYFIMITAVFFLMLSFTEAANRYSFNLMIFTMIFIGFLLDKINNFKLKYSLSLVIAVSGIALYIYINSVGVQFFYFGQLSNILDDNVIEILQKIRL